MPYKKKYHKKRSKRPHYKRKMGYNPRKRPSNVIMSSVFRDWSVTHIGNKANGLETANTLRIKLSDFNGTLPYVELFGQYRIMKIKYEFIPVTGNKAITETADATSAERPLLATTINHVDTSEPQSLEQIMTTAGVQYVPCGRRHVRYFTPNCFEEVYKAGITASNARNPAYKQWISTNSTTVEHGFLQWVIGSAGDLPADYYKFRLLATVYCQFKNKRVNTDNTRLMYDASGDVVDAVFTEATSY